MAPCSEDSPLSGNVKTVSGLFDLLAILVRKSILIFHVMISMFSYTLWMLWKMRNEKFLNNQQQGVTPKTLTTVFLSQVKEQVEINSWRIKWALKWEWALLESLWIEHEAHYMSREF